MHHPDRHIHDWLYAELHMYVEWRSLPLKISALQCAVCAINVAITGAFPPESRETRVKRKLFKYNMTHDKASPHFAYRSASIIQFSAWFCDVGDSVCRVRQTAYDDVKSSCAPRLSAVRRSAAAPDQVYKPYITYQSIFFVLLRINARRWAYCCDDIAKISSDWLREP